MACLPVGRVWGKYTRASTFFVLALEEGIIKKMYQKGKLTFAAYAIKSIVPAPISLIINNSSNNGLLNWGSPGTRSR